MRQSIKVSIFRLACLVLTTLVLVSVSQVVSYADVTAVTVGAQTGTLTYGTAASATYLITVTKTNGGNETITLTVTTTLPTGVTASFSPNPITGVGNPKTSTLTLTTTATALPEAGFTFTVQATQTSSVTNTGTLVIGKGTATTGLVRTTGSSPSTYGTSLTFTATVTKTGTGATPTGTVNFRDGATSISGCSAQTLSAGSATCTTSTLTVSGSPHSITAVYSGDTNYNTSTSGTVSQTVTKGTPTFSGLTASQIIEQGHASITLSGTIAAGSVAPTAGETVTITINSANTSATITGTAGAFSASVSTGALTPNLYTITYSYAGDSNFNSATDSSTTLTVEYDTLITFRSFTATPQDGGVLLQWQTGREVSNLGFHLYRDGVRLTRSPVAGSALLAGSSTVLTAGNSYRWLDPSGTSLSSYTLEDVDLNGTKSVHGPFPVNGPSASTGGVKQPAAGGRTSPLLSQLGKAVTANDRSFTNTTFDPEDGRATASPSGHRLDLAAPVRGVAVNQQYALAAGQAVKFGVQHEGWYHVDASQLAAAGMPAGIGPDSLQLFVEGREQALAVQVSNGQVGAIEFYATGLDTTFSDTRVYWLVWGGNSGLRVQSSGAESGGNAPASFQAAVEWRPRSVYFPALLNGDADNFFGPTLDSTDPVTQSLAVTHLNAAASGSSTLQVTMQGVNIGPHAIMVQLNGSQLGSLSFNDQASSTSTFTVPNSLLREGANTLALATSGQGDVTLVDTVLLSYPHSYTADGDYLRLNAPSGSPVTIGGFSNNQIQVMDITDPANVSSLAGTIAPQGTAFAVSFAPSGRGTRTLLAFTNAQKSQPVSITAHHPSSWHTSQAGADIVMISHADFIPSLGPLQSLRQTQGHTVAVIDVQDAYDEFNFGEQSPYAIQTLLSTANSAWTTKPHWVLLVGDATYDPRNYLGTGQVDYLPVPLVDTALLETSSDDWFVDFNGDGIPEMAIGRLPVDSAATASALVSKIVAYDQAGAAVWKNRALLVSGANDSYDTFESYTSAVQALLPASSAVTKILQGSDSNAATDFMTALNGGQGLVNFVGHGSTEVWDGGLFSSTAAGTVTNGSATPFVISMTCLNGYFQDVFTFSLAKALLQASGGGAVGVWASSTLTSSGPQATLNQSMIGALFGASPMTVGDAAMAAKKTVTDPDVRRTWILFGDPAMTLR